MKNRLIYYENLDQKAYHVVKEMIEHRQLLPGQKIPQEKLAAELGISRTPLINALKFLEQEKLIVTQPRRGFFVRVFTMEEMVSIFEIREVLEGLTARRAALSITPAQKIHLVKIFQPFRENNDIVDYQTYSKADRHFHNYLTEISTREFLSSILQTFNIVSLAYQFPTREGLIRPPNETIREHLNIVNAICNHDPAAAEQCMRIHLQRTAAKLIRDIESDKSHQKGGGKTSRNRVNVKQAALKST